VTLWSHWRRGRFWVEIVLAVVVGVAAFVVAAVVSTAARSHVPAVLLGLLLLLAVLAVARFVGVLYALPVGVVTILAFDWYFLPPLRALDAATVVVLGLFLGVAVIVGAVATQAGRRAAGSEQARGVLADEQAALRRVATLVARQPSPAEVFAAVTEETARTARLLHLDSAHLIVYERDQMATVVASWSLRGPPMPVGTRVPLEGDNIIGRVFRTQQSARIDDYGDASGQVAENVRAIGVRAAVGVPVLVGGRLWGVMAVGSSRPEPLPAETEMRIAAFTELVAMAIANTAARTELEQVAAEQAALGRVATLVAEAVPPGDVFTAVADEVAGLFGVPLVGLFRYEADGAATVIAAAGKLSPYLGQRWTSPDGDPGLVASLRTGRPLRIDDYSQVTGAGTDTATELGVGAAAGVPVIVDDRVWGAVTLGLAKDRPPLPHDTVDRLTGFTKLVATAIANAAARTEISRLAEEQAALRRVTTLVAGGTQPGEVFAAVGEEIGRIRDAEAACVVRYEPGATGTVMATWGDASFWPIGSNWALEGVAARVLHTRRAARMDGYSQDSGEMTAMARRIGGRSRVGTPIIIEDRLWGAALAVNFASGGALPATAEERIANFADLITTAISNSETRTELTASRARVVAAADETRRRLERDLHDGIQQRLVSLALKARAIETMTPQPADNIQGELSRLADGLGTSLDELREISRGIHPAILSEAGLGPALKALARRSAVPVNLDLNLGSRTRQPLEVAAYYVASEALTNAAKHAQASVIDIRADGSDGALTLWIHDDGIGGADPSRGSGIIGLKDRVEALGGTISLLSPPGHGTTLHVQLPTGPSAAPTLPRRTP